MEPKKKRKNGPETSGPVPRSHRIDMAKGAMILFGFFLGLAP